MTRRVVIASHNPDKLVEVEAVLATLPLGMQVVRGLTWPDIPETESTLEGNALLKARTVVAHTGCAAIADDTGLEVDALSGAPGVHTARFAGPGATYAQNVARLLDELADADNRTARFRTAMAFVSPEGVELVAEGILEGQITRSPRGTGGFGYDPVFAVDGRTLAEIPPAEKNLISHRARAIAALVRSMAGLAD